MTRIQHTFGPYIVRSMLNRLAESNCQFECYNVCRSFFGLITNMLCDGLKEKQVLSLGLFSVKLDLGG